jgi:formylglycine-generating enzyme required for sulfatase activity
MSSKSSTLLASVLLAPFAQAQNPQPYCTAGTSTNGCTPSINANVQPNTSNTAGCVITVSGVPGLMRGIVFYGRDNTGFTPTPWGAASSSFRCVKPPITRLGPPLDAGGSFGQCDGSYAVHWDMVQTSSLGFLSNSWLVGEPVYTQAWYRDPFAAKASNLSNAVELTLVAPPTTPPPPTPCVTALPGMVLIQPGTFMMGSNAAGGLPYNNSSLSQPVHQVTISYCFWMGATEVTQAQYAAVMGSNPSLFLGDINRPVEQVNWSSAREYCAQLNWQQSVLGNVPPGYHYRLPTEAEWEYACRAGTTTEFNVGASLDCSQARFAYSFHPGSGCSASGTVPVASYAPNAWGLHDMHGNVWEWCLDSLATYPVAAVTDPFVTGSPDRVLRGGGVLVDSDDCRSASRGYHYAVDYTAHNIGFRVVLAPIRFP